MRGLVNAIVRFSDHAVERLTLSEEAEVGTEIDARGGRWRITRMSLPWGLDEPGYVLFDIDVEPAASTSPPHGS